MFKSFLHSLGFHERRNVLLSPLAGKVIPLSEVNDPTFASGSLGEGVAIEPTGDKVVAPFDGKVKAVFPTGHAVALHTNEGLDVLIHIGLDTYKLDGRHFKVRAAEGDSVKRGDVLIEFDRDAIRSEGYDITAPILICNSVEYSSIKGNVGDTVSELEKLLTARER
ncbi:PTS glucose transporter subunit IIA [Enorma burkinafasonensis]|uniref:PTS sugar transporter subunit IIA n=1 Tax=Enorma burkinafasonensis TaxID=2590867 RepID=UPI0026F02152|nr:PTS glucose transporter subunit IIA [Enorma burkinafasonensis]MCI7730081.1 PTS glucose transporter subunit IIA [Enorma burkinafasonensis]